VHEPSAEARADSDRSLKSNLLQFTLEHAPPDPPRPSLLRGLVTLVVMAIGAGLIGMTIWSLITL
jgi:hypothetical protein